jgi:cell division transport system permease protein
VRQIGASLWFALHSAGQNFRRNLGVSLAGVFTMGLIIFLVGGALLFTHSVDTVLQGQEQNASHLKIYLSDNASLAAISNFETELQHDRRVISVTFETKDQAKKQASQNSPDIASALNVLGSNPLPASLNLNVRRLTDLSQFNAMAKATPIVDSTTPTDYNADVISKLNTVITVIEWVGAIIAVILLTISIVIIMNTIRTAVYSRRTEIEIMKLVGATDWFVRWPFILEGMLGGLLAAIFSGAIVFAAYRLFVQAAQGNLLSVPFDTKYTVTLLILLLVGGVGVGAFGSFLGVRRFLSA